jgi:hypothetical protein
MRSENEVQYDWKGVGELNLVISNTRAYFYVMSFYVVDLMPSLQIPTCHNFLPKIIYFFSERNPAGTVKDLQCRLRLWHVRMADTGITFLNP